MSTNNSYKTFDTSLKVIAPAKVNLHLEILGLRKDGFHELAMLMQSIDLFDEIEFFKTTNSEIKLSCDNPNLSLNDDNLIIKAAKLIRRVSNNEQLGVEIYLKKNIPIGAGLAGGSSDGAAVLLGLNELWQLGLSIKQLEELSAELGSDVPFCLRGGTQFCFGRGELVEPVSQGDDSMAVILVKDPKTSVSTPWAYSRYKELNSTNYLNLEKDFEVRRKFLREVSWINPLTSLNPPPLKNDLQKVIEPITPAVRNGLHFLSSLNGVLSLAMSGSGPSCFAVFANLDSAQIEFKKNQKKLESLGFNGWCCSFRSKGVTLCL
ncbi:4-(cytidine 5'-diphospho)-2-C-methyl-D-erythritol kinase [Prochlorococcus marinus]|uniref:4-(cytidine 5'-diphospho)-2-C-methyl-D-erythritol kinase n=1 Tax=Prochlorococcus marinus TaxID=1219 RepID=UPI0022B3DBCF|nr:4-(cytidine 5'-diphospho)-2-C-methyl-D-erythritol kinase [Prochlorococcus marinus]